jgi:uncharacterized protein
MESLSDKLKSLGVSLGASQLKSPTPKKHGVDIEQVLPGEDDTTQFGRSFIVRKSYDAHYFQGNVQLYETVDQNILLKWAKINHPDKFSRDKAAFIDTETSGLAGGTGTFIFLFGMGFYSGEGFQLCQVFLRSPAEEQAFLATISRLMDPFDTVVTFNGKSFDVPLLNSRHVINRFHSPFAEMQHIDVLHLARRIWRNRLENRNLGSLEKEILMMERSGEEIPGWLVPELYYDYLQTGDASPLGGVFYHNANDILSLAALFNHLGKLLNDPVSEASQHGLDLLAVAQLYEDLELFDASLSLYEQCLSSGLSKPFYIKAITRFADLYRRQQKWDQAVNLWKKAVDYRQIEACVELSKFYEHRSLEINEAVNYTKFAILFAREDITSPFLKKRTIQELEHRLARLEHKLPPQP